MKALKNKIVDELKRFNHAATVSANPITTSELNEVYRLSKALCYLDKAECVIKEMHKEEEDE